jgi:DNA polymerase-3 subunit gamma/tau
VVTPAAPTAPPAAAAPARPSAVTPPSRPRTYVAAEPRAVHAAPLAAPPRSAAEAAPVREPDVPTPATPARPAVVHPATTHAVAAHAAARPAAARFSPVVSHPSRTGPVRSHRAPPTPPRPADHGLTGLLPSVPAGVLFAGVFAALLTALALSPPPVSRVLRARTRTPSAASLRLLLERPG